MSNNNIIFILFQGAGTNLKSWNEYTKSKFLDKLKLLGILIIIFFLALITYFTYFIMSIFFKLEELILGIKHG